MIITINTCFWDRWGGRQKNWTGSSKLDLIEYSAYTPLPQTRVIQRRVNAFGHVYVFKCIGQKRIESSTANVA